MSRTRVKKTGTARFVPLADAKGRRMGIATTGASIAFLAVLILAL